MIVRPIYVHITPVASGAETAEHFNRTNSATAPNCACNIMSCSRVVRIETVDGYRRARNGWPSPQENTCWLGS